MVALLAIARIVPCLTGTPIRVYPPQEALISVPVGRVLCCELPLAVVQDAGDALEAVVYRLRDRAVAVGAGVQRAVRVIGVGGHGLRGLLCCANAS